MRTEAIPVREFQLTVRNQPGSFAKVAAALGDAGVAIEVAAGMGRHGEGLIRLVADDSVKTRLVLRSLGISFEEKEVLVVDVGSHPHGLADVLDRLAAAGVNVESAYAAIGRNKLVLAVDNLEQARAALQRPEQTRVGRAVAEP
jgi:hypothetical protein